MPTDLQARPFKHDAFIAYSRKNLEFAIKLEEALESYKPPKGLNLPQRRLDVFRDEKDFGTGEYYQAVERELSQSAKLIVICSPESRASKYVNHEIKKFTELRGAEHIIPVLIKGIPTNEFQGGREDDLAFCDALCNVKKMPLAARYLDFDLKRDKMNKGKFSQPWFDVLASVYELTPSEIEQRDRKRESRTRKIQLAITASVIAILSILLIQAIEARNDAQQKTLLATSNAYVATMNLAGIEFERGNQPRGYELLSMYLPTKIAAQREEDRRSFYWYYLWHQNNLELTPLSGDTAYTWSVAFSPDGRTLASGGGDFSIKLWDVQSRKELITLTGHTSIVTSVIFSPDGRTLASASRDQSVKLWNVETRKELATLAGHTYAVWSVAFSPNGRTLASASEDNSVKLWDVQSRKELATLLRHESSVNSVAFSPDGRTMVSGSANGTIRQWIGARDEEIALNRNR